VSTDNLYLRFDDLVAWPSRTQDGLALHCF
jgi:hypothetical protein